MAPLTFPKLRAQYPIDIDRPLDDMIAERRRSEHKERLANPKPQMEAPLSFYIPPPCDSVLRKRKRITGSWSAEQNLLSKGDRANKLLKNTFEY